MSILDKISSLFSRTPDKEQERDTPVSFIQTGLGSYLGTDTRIREDTAIREGSKGIIATAQHTNAVRVAEHGLYVLRCQDQGRTVRRTRDMLHPVSKLLWQPNPLWTLPDMLELLTRHYDGGGAGYWIINRAADGTPRELWPVPNPGYISPIPDEKVLIKGWWYQPYWRPGKVRLELQDVIAFRRPHPLNPLKTMSIIEEHAYEADTDYYAKIYGKAQMESGGRKDLLARTSSTDPDTNRRTQKILGKQVREAHKKDGVLTVGKHIEEVTELNMSPNDLQYVQMSKMNTVELLAAFGLSPSVVGIEENSNRSISEEAFRRWNRAKIKPLLDRFASAIEMQLVPQFGEAASRFQSPREWIEIGYDNPVPEDEQLKATVQRIRIQAGTLTQNEARAEWGDQPYDPEVGGDKPWTTVGSLPQDALLAEHQAQMDTLSGGSGSGSGGQQAKAAGPVEERDQAADVPGEEERAREWERYIAKLHGPYERKFLKTHIGLVTRQRQRVMDNLDSAMRSAPLSEAIERFGPRIQGELAGAYRETIERKLARGIGGAGKALAEILDAVPAPDQVEGDVRSALIEGFAAGEDLEAIDERAQAALRGGTIVETIDEIMPDEKHEVEQFGSTSQSLLGEMIAAAGTYETQKYDTEFNGQRPEVATYAKALAFQDYAQQVNATTMESLRQTLLEGLQNGEGVRKIGQRIGEVYDAFAGYRGQLIARTETTTALNFGTDAGIRQVEEAGIELERYWISSRDSRVRKTHRKADGQVRGPDGHYVVGHSKAKYPGDNALPPEERANCRCNEGTRRKQT